MKKTRIVPFDINKAKNGAKIVTRNGLYPARIGFFDLEGTDLPIVAAIKMNGKETPYEFTIEGNFYPEKTEDAFDLFIEEEEEETDDYDPYKATVESIADMAERYSELQSLEELKDFYNNVRVKCREAVEYNLEDEKPADNKPKFKVGDWVINIDKQGVVHQITNIIKNVSNHTYGYNAETYTYGFFGYSYFSENVKSMRLWNIKDAKDGDVLYSGEVIFIFNRIKGEWIHCYCTLHRDGSFISENYDLMHIKHCKEVQPATKGQRELLFQKMKEEGYEWDSDKKELNKIEKVKIRRMTNQELAWWLRDSPEEHRECSMLNDDGGVFDRHIYYDEDANKPVKDGIIIRRNGGEWEEPLIEL